jgi:hypothetical protein
MNTGNGRKKDRKFTVAGPITNICRKQKLAQSQSTFYSQLSGYKDLWWNAEFIRQRELIASLENPHPFPDELAAELNDAEMISAAQKLWVDILADRKVGVFGAAGIGKTFLIRAMVPYLQKLPKFQDPPNFIKNRTTLFCICISSLSTQSLRGLAGWWIG